MYDELIKSIHCCFGFEEPAVTDCENCMMKDKREEHNYVGCCDALGLAAADAIEELQADKAALNGTVTNLLEQIKALGKPRWIPVNERLPEPETDVLSFRIYGSFSQMSEVTMNDMKKNGEWCYEGVTHWMPLPSTEGLNET